jgi:hypothetical protein
MRKSSEIPPYRVSDGRGIGCFGGLGGHDQGTEERGPQSFGEDKEHAPNRVRRGFSAEPFTLRIHHDRRCLGIFGPEKIQWRFPRSAFLSRRQPGL